MNNERVETIISVKEREEDKKSDEDGKSEKKKDAKTGDKKEGELGQFSNQSFWLAVRASDCPLSRSPDWFIEEAPIWKPIIVKKEKAEEGALSLDIFKSYFRAFGWSWSLIYIFWSLAYQAGDIIYNVWLAEWVDAIPYYDTLKSDGSNNCIQIIPGQDQNTARIGSISDQFKIYGPGLRIV